MTNKKTTPTDEDRRRAREWAEGIEANPKSWSLLTRTAARVILNAVPALPNLSDMTHAERRECQWMRCDVAGLEGDWLIIDPFDDESHAHVVDRLGDARVLPTHHVTPRPDLARMEWTGTGQDGEEVTKVDYVSVAGGRTAYGPWTVARLRKKPDTVPPNTLAVGSAWDDAGALRWACMDSGFARIVMLDCDGEPRVWDAEAGRWRNGGPMPGYTPYTIVHTEQKADQ